jgi:uncharacterized phage protein (TIGR01671 family)
MNREIKFRVWHKIEKKYLLPSNEKIKSQAIFFLNKNGNLEASLNNHNFIIQQFTGLKDKNNKEIYEGDILSWENTIRGIPAPSKDAKPFKPEEVYWDNELGIWAIGSMLDNDFHWYGKKGTIIGNIFENPELIDSPVEQ